MPTNLKLIIGRKEKGVDLYKIRGDCLRDLVSVTGEFLTNDRQRSIWAFIKDYFISEQLPDTNKLKRVLTKPNKMVLEGILNESTISSNSFLDIFKGELLKILETTNSENYFRFRNFLSRFKPEKYELPYNIEYILKRCDSKKKFLAVVEKLESCLNEEAVKEQIEDKGTIIFLLTKNGDDAGYCRLFKMVNEEEGLVLALDTIEVARKDFDMYRDCILAMGAAIVQFAYDSKINYLIGEDSRVGFGLRQGFSNYKKIFCFKKLGARLNSYYDYSYFNESESYVLFEHWRKNGS